MLGKFLSAVFYSLLLKFERLSKERALMRELAVAGF